MIPEYTDMLNPALISLSRRPPCGFRDIRSDVELYFGMSPAEKAERTPSDSRYLVSQKLRRALQELIRDGLVRKMNRDEYQITDAGRAKVALNPTLE